MEWFEPGQPDKITGRLTVLQDDTTVESTVRPAGCPLRCARPEGCSATAAAPARACAACAGQPQHPPRAHPAHPSQSRCCPQPTNCTAEPNNLRRAVKGEGAGEGIAYVIK